MQEVKNNLKKIGENMRASHDAHKESLRHRLTALHPEEPVLLPKRLTWFPVLSWGAVVVIALVIGNAMYDRSAAYDTSVSFNIIDNSLVDERDGMGAVSEAADMVTGGWFADGSEMIASYPPGVKNDVTHEDIVDYEEDNGAMLEQSVNISMLTQEDDASETVVALFASLGGHLSSIHSNDDNFTTITGSIPVSRMSLFYEQLDMLVKSDAFIEKIVQGDSVIREAIDIAQREQDLRDVEAEMTEQLQRAETTDEQKKVLRQSLELISDEMIELTRERDALDNRVDYVTVSVTIEELPSIWGVQNTHQLNDVIAGYESPTLWQKILINVLTVFFIAVEFFSLTFWILIPLGIFFIVHFRRRRVFRELD